MLELSMNEVTTFRWSFEEDVENYRRAGYRSIGVWRHKLSDLDEEYAVDLLAGSGLSVSSLACAGGFTGLGGVSFREGIDDAITALRLAAKMQAGCLVVHPGGRNNHTSRHAFRLLRHGARRAVADSPSTTKCRSRSSRCTWPARPRGRF